MEAIMLVIIAGAFAVFLVGVGYVDTIANAKAITYDEEQARRKPVIPAQAEKPVALKQAA